jgi:hypothetical protein
MTNSNFRLINIVYTIGAEFSNNEHTIMDLTPGCTVLQFRSSKVGNKVNAYSLRMAMC